MSPALLGLVMIVKNEAQGIATTLSSAIPYIDAWTILDTGSTDGTQQVIQTCCANIKGQLCQEPFVDFAATRNRVLDLHGETTQFTIMLSGDDVLVHGGELRNFLSKLGDSQIDVFNIERAHGTDRFMTSAVQRTATKDWRYVGRTHEVLTKPGHYATVQIPKVQILRLQDVPAETKRKRWEADLGILQEDVRKNPNDMRARFYLAQTYECLGRFQEALQSYEQRANMQGWEEECYEAIYRSARCLANLRAPWPIVEARYLQAHSKDPRRAEPLCAIAEYWHACGEHALTYLYASRAAALPYPKTLLFVDATVYGQLDVPGRAAELAATARVQLQY